MVESIKERLVNVYLDIDSTTKKVFYVGIGKKSRIHQLKRNRYHKRIVNSLPNNFFIRKIIYKDILIEKAWKIEKQIIKKCGRIFNKTGFLTNIHEGGPLPFEDVTGYHWLRGKKVKDIMPDYISPKLGRSYDIQYGDRKHDIIARQSYNRQQTRKKRIETVGLTQKEIEYIKRNIERRKNKQFTDNELKSFRDVSLRQKGKTMRERLDDPHWVSPKTGKTIQEICNNPDYVNPTKGKTAKEIHGIDYVDSRCKSFYIQIDDEEPIFCENERAFFNIFNSNDHLLRKLKKVESNRYKIKRLSISVHYFADESTIKLNYISSENAVKLEQQNIDDILNRQKQKINDWNLVNSVKPVKKKFNLTKYRHSFYITINNNEPIFCKSESDCCEKFKCDKGIILKIKKAPDMVYNFTKRSGNSEHLFPDYSVVKIQYATTPLSL